MSKPQDKPHHQISTPPPDLPPSTWFPNLWTISFSKSFRSGCDQASGCGQDLRMSGVVLVVSFDRSFRESQKHSKDLYLTIGFDVKTARQTISNPNLTSNLTTIIHEAAVSNGCDTTTGNLLYSVTTRFPEAALVHLSAFIKYIITSKIKFPAQVDAAFVILKNIGSQDFTLTENEWEMSGESCLGQILG